jgi:transcriptional regulator with XRE-family HTH domain
MYEIFNQLLEKSGVKAIDVSRATGIPSSTFTDWKKGRSVPKQEKLLKIADYFNVSIDYLMNGEEKNNQPYYIDEEAAETAQEIYDNDKILFDVYRTVDKDRLVEFAKKLAELRKLEEGDE